MRFVTEPFLPKGYTRLEYLESTGTQYIDTGIIPTNNMEFRTKINFTSISSGDVSIIAARVGGNNRTQPVFCYANKWTVAIGNTYDSNGASVSTNTDYDIRSVITEGKTITLYANGSQVATLTNTGGIADVPFYIFARNYGTFIDAYSSLKMNYMKIYSGGVLVRDLIPALNSSNVAGMYDRVNHVFYTNAGTGTFVYKVAEPIDDNTIDNPKYQQVEYLKSDGNQYISTGVSKGSVSTFGLEATMSFDDRTVVNALGVGQSLSGGCFGIKNGSNANIYFNLTGSDEYSTYTYTVGVPLYFNLDGVAKTFTIKDLSGTTLYTDTRTTSTVTDNTNIILFGYINTSGNNPRKQTIYNCKIYNDGELVRHFIPVIRKVDNKPGMYDKVTGNFYTNQGTGEFTYGDKVNQTLPAAYDKLDYIEASGAQYIDTGYLANSNTKIELDFTLSSVASSAVFGGRAGPEANSFTIWSCVTTSSNKSRFDYTLTGANNILGQVLTLDTRYTFLKDKEKNYIDGVALSSNGVKEYTTSYPAYLFAVNSAGTAGYFHSGRMYYCKVWDNDVLVRNFVPALRKADNKPGMYDFVTNTFFINQGTDTDFTYAYPIKPLSNSLTRMIKTVRIKPYKCELEYIESTGTQWFDTGISATGDSYEADYKLRTSNNTFIIAGARSETQHLNLGQFEAGSTQRLYLAYYDTYWQSGTQPITPNTEFVTHAVLKYGEQYAMLNGTKICANTHTGREVINLNIYLLKRNYYGETDTIAPMKGRLYFFKLWRNGVLVRDYIPVKDMNDVVCLYDKVSGTLYYNQGTGTLDAGKEIHLIESLESTGSQYIDTGVHGFADFEIGIKLRTNASNVAVFCSTNYRLERYNVTNPYWRFRNNTTYYNSSVPITEYHVMKWKNNEVYADDIKLQDLNKTWNVDANMTLFGLPSSGFFPNIIYFCKLWDPTDGTLLRDFVPARDENNQGYLFDKLTHTLFGNNGSGAFTLGDDIPEVTTTTTTRFVQGGLSTGIYKPLNYLESTGVQYIETKIYPSPKAEFEMKAKLTEIKVNSCFFGASTDWAWGSFTNSSLAFANSSSGQVFCVYSNSGQTGTITAIPGGTYADFTTEFKNYTWKVNGTTITEFTPIESWTNANMPAISIFNRKIYNQSQQDTKGKYRIYYLKIWDNGVLVGDFVPVLRKYDQKPGMYDSVTNTFYTNMGTGNDFLYG